MEDKQKIIDNLFLDRHKEYDQIRELADENEKLYQMNLFYINNLKLIFECLRDNADVRLVNIERFSRNDGSNVPMYVPSYVNKDGISKLATNGYPYKATALMKLLYGFSSYVENEKLQ